MARQVRGVLFANQVRTLRAAKHIRWEEQLAPQDLRWLTQRIESDAWYPMDAYESLGLAILDQVVMGDLEVVRQWGRQTIDALRDLDPGLLAGRDPRELFLRFQLLRHALFNFAAAEVVALRDDKAVIELRFGMSPRAEEAAAAQAVGFFESLMEVLGAPGADVSIQSRSWKGDAATRIAISWGTGTD